MQISLLGGAYTARSVIASAQRCVNLYPELNQLESFQGLPQVAGAASLITHYPTPGLTKVSQADKLPVRGMYRASNDLVYLVVGPSVYYMDRTLQTHFLGSIANNVNRVSMVDNGIVLVLVDGTPNGYTINLSTNAFAPINDPTGLFTGADVVDYVDTFFVFNKRDTQAFYCSLSNSITFDPTYIANKTASADTLITLAVAHREIWLLGDRTTEVWADAGNPLFPFEAVPGAFIQHGCAAKDSVCVADNAVYWLSQDAQGQAIVMRGQNYQAERISSHAIENDFQGYAAIDDAIAHIHQIQGHVFYTLSFPTADKTWVYDTQTGLWHERVYIDNDGIEHRTRANVGCFAWGKYFCGDYQNGAIYYYDINNYTDDGQTIKRLRSFPHMVNELKRIYYHKFIADMQTGAEQTGMVSPKMWLRWSDDRGVTWNNGLTQSLGNIGQTQQIIQFNRLGMARDRVFEVSWSDPVMSALNGAFIDVSPGQS